MHFNDLPDDVMVLVFRATLLATKCLPADLKAGLRLLSVCRRWREVALPMVYDTVVIKCSTKGTDGPETVYIRTTLDWVVDAKCLHVVRNVVIDARYRTSPLQGLRAAIGRMRGAAGMWAGVRKLGLSLDAWGSGNRDMYPPAAGHEGEIASVSSALTALMPGLREITFDALLQTPVVRVLYGQLAGFYADQLQVLHLSNSLIVPQDLVFARLRDVKITGAFYGSLEGQLPRFDPDVVESLVLEGLTDNDMWSMFCADPDGRAIIFPRLTNLDLVYRSSYIMRFGQLLDERPWALQFPAAKRVRIACSAEECPSMENAVFPDSLESLDITACPCMLPVFAGRKVHVSWNLALSVKYDYGASDRGIDIANHMLAESVSHSMRRLVVGGKDATPPELITYKGLTHLQLNAPTNAYDVMEFIHRLPHLVNLYVGCLTPANTQTDFSIPECAEHEPVAPLDTQIRWLSISHFEQSKPVKLALSMLKYLMLKIPTLKSVTTLPVLTKQIRAFIDEYVQWYPHLANVKLME